jgi:hypothetical protein
LTVDADTTRSDGHGAQRPARVSLRSLVIQAGGVLAAPADGELLLIREATDECYALRGSGVEIWAAARQTTSVADICDRLLRVYAIDRPDCERAVLRAVEELVDNGLLVAS